MAGRPALAVVALACLALGLAPAQRVGGNEAASASRSHGPLDGMRFEGRFGPADEPADLEDMLYFGDGKFWSDICIRCGFPPGAYWVRYEEEAIHFRGVLESAERGRFVYTGTVRDGRLTADVSWRRERWYWTIDRDFRFEGTLAESDAEMSATRATRLAMSAGPPPEGDCEP